MINKYNTDPTIYDKKLSKEPYANLLETLEAIPLLTHMINIKRKKAKDLPRDKENKIIVELPNIHILEDMDFFRQRAIFFQKHGVYTKLFPNSNKNSQYYKFWEEEARRCKEGYIRQSDGEWISGYFYFYLNYSPIMKTIAIGDTSGESIKAEREYDFPDVWDGDYMFFHYVDRAWESGARYGTVLKARGKGYSFKAGSMLVRNMVFYPMSVSYAMASDTEYLETDGVLNKAWDSLDWINGKTAWGKMFGKDTMMHKKFSYKDMDTGAELGYKSQIIGVTLKNNPSKSRGKRGKLILWEEAGSFPNLLKSWKIAQKSLEDGNRTFGFMLAFGTGGDSSSNFMSLEELFYKPEGYRVYPMVNMFDINALNSVCAFFAPDYLNRADCYDKNGNSDVVKAVMEVVERRFVIKYNTSDPNAVTMAKAEEPFTPQEATARVTHSLFPIGELKETLAEIKPNEETFLSSHYVGELVYTDVDNVSWHLDSSLHALRDYPIKDTNISGALEIFELPKKGDSERPARGRYIIGVDPVDADTGTSMFSFFVFDLFMDNVVAEFTGRKPTANQNFEVLIKASLFYNAKINYENNLKGLFSYFDHKNLLYLLMDTPQILRDQELIKQIGYGNKAHPYSEYIYTPRGKKQWGDIQIGDVIFGDDGKQTNVIDIPFDDYTDIYKITLWDKRIVYASENHLWKINRDGYKGLRKYTTNELLSIYKRPKRNNERGKTYTMNTCSIPVNKPINFKKIKTPIDAYTLGLILGDGSTKGNKGNRIRFTSNLQDVEFYKKEIPYSFTTPSDDRHMYIKIKNGSGLLKDLNLSNKTSINKFIPNIYKYNTINTRLAILQGLFDTDGHIESNGFPKYSTISEQLADDVLFIARSLGYNAKKYENKAGYKKNGVYIKCNNVYNIVVWTTSKLFKLPRKFNKQSNFSKGRGRARLKGMTISNIEFSHREKAKCITVDNKSNCYLINDFIVTHNSKGTPANKGVNLWARKLFADWLLTAHQVDDETEVLNIKRLRSIGLLKEALYWNIDGNFDRISSIGMVMVAREELYKQTRVQKEGGPTYDVDPFLEMNYKGQYDDVINFE